MPLRRIAAYIDTEKAISRKIEWGHRTVTREHIVELASFFKFFEGDLLVSWLSGKFVDEAENEKGALKATWVAQERIKQQNNTNRRK